MNGLTAEQRGDLAEAMLPHAAAIVVDVHEGDAADIAERLGELSHHELQALVVVIAGLTDPDRPLKEALAWVNFDEYGDRLPPSWSGTRSEKTLRDVVPKVRRELAGIDVVAVHRALATDGAMMRLSTAERRLAIDVGNRRGLPKEWIAARLGMSVDAVDRSWVRIKQRAREEGRPVPMRPAHPVVDVAS